MKLKLPIEFLVKHDYSLTALIDFTAKAIKKKDESFSKVQKRVRARVRDHQARGKLPAKEEIRPEIFFAWALEFERYQALKDIDGLPVSALVEVPGVSADVAAPFGSAVIPPTSYDGLREAYLAERSVNQSLLRENISLRAEIQSLKNEVISLDRRRKALSKTLSAAGKKGGRGNES